MSPVDVGDRSFSRTLLDPRVRVVLGTVGLSWTFPVKWNDTDFASKELLRSMVDLSMNCGPLN